MAHPGRSASVSRVFVFSSFLFCCVSGDGWFGWVFGEQDGGAGAYQSKPYAGALPPSSLEAVNLEAVEAPFEIHREDAFLTEVEKYTGLKMSELDRCQHQVIYTLKTACSKMSEEQIAKMGVQLLNCQSHVEGRTVYPCSSEMTLKECTYDMDSNAWNAYHLMSNRARAVCYAARQQQFAVRTELTVNRLVQSTQDHIQNLNKIKEGQDELGRLTSATLTEVSRGHEALAEKQTQLKEAQKTIYGFVSENLRELSKEKVLIAAVQSELDSMGRAMRGRLDEAADHLRTFENSRRIGHEEILKDLKEVHAKTREAWDRVDQMAGKILTIHGQTLSSLSKINSSIGFLQEVMENVDVQVNDKLKWLNNTLSMLQMDEMGRLEDLLVIVSHVIYLLVAALLSSFLHIPMVSRIFMIFVIPLNAASSITEKDLALDFPSLTVLILFVLGLELVFKYYGPKWLELAKSSTGRESCGVLGHRNAQTPVATVAPVAARMSRIAGGTDVGALSDEDEVDGDVDCRGGGPASVGDGSRSNPRTLVNDAPGAGGGLFRRRILAGGGGSGSSGGAAPGRRNGDEAAASSSLFPPFCSTPRLDAPAGGAGPPPLSRVPPETQSYPSTSGGGRPRLPAAGDVLSAKRSLLDRLLQDQSERRDAAELSDPEDGDDDVGRGSGRGSFVARRAVSRAGTPMSYASSAGGGSRRSGSGAPLCAGRNRLGENCRKLAVRNTQFCSYHQEQGLE